MDRERFSGSLIGQCLGDALGFPVEGFRPGVRDLRRPHSADARRGAPPRASRTRSGSTPTTRSLQRELLGELCAAHGRFDPEDYARRIAAIFAEDRIVGRGLATHRAALRPNSGVGWEEAGELPPAAGNGSAMRAGPGRPRCSTTIAPGSCASLTTRDGSRTAIPAARPGRSRSRARWRWPRRTFRSR